MSDFVIEDGVLKKYTGHDENVIIPNGVTSIGWEAFYDCRSLKSVEIPDGVTSIGNEAFESCSSLKSIKIPNSVTHIGVAAFGHCCDLRDVESMGRVASIAAYEFQNCRSLGSVKIPNGVTSIESKAFSGCRSLESVEIPDSVTSIESEAFQNCSSLCSVEIPNGVTSIGSKAFSGCRSLRSVEIPAGVMSIEWGTFDGCSSLSSVEIPNSVTSIESAAFYNCSSLGSVKIPNSVTSIGDEAFYECSSLSSVEIPNSVTSIGGAFFNCRSLSSVEISDSVTSIGHYAFCGCSSLSSVKIPNNVTSIGDRAFYYCSSLSSVEICADMTSIGESAFKLCKKLADKDGFVIINGILFDFIGEQTDVRIPDGVTSIGNSAFQYCRSLSSIEIPSSVTSIGEDAFKECTSLSVVRAEESDELFRELKKSKSKNVQFIFPYLTDRAAAAGEEQVAAMIKEISELKKDKQGGELKTLALIGKLLYNDTPAAMRFAEKRGLLDEYAKLRDVTADELREQNMSSFGLDENGECRWTLAGREIITKLNADLVLTLTDGKNGKAIKSIPKKDADPAAYEAANNAYKDMKKSLSEMIKIWGNKLFAEFLSGESRSSGRWQKLFLGNPMMRGLGRLLVWAQDGNTFTLHEDGKPYDVNGNAYTLTDVSVAVAHPMEMKQEEVAAWQGYFLSNSLKQPFEQVWEPVVDAALVKENRYDGCTIELYRLMNKDKHGIVMKGQSAIELQGCSADLKYIEGHSDWIHNLFEVRNFKYDAYTRQVNHIVVLLDRGTMEGRIAKDDISAMALLDEFTAAQITDFIRVASENHADNVTASLLAYKNSRFPEIDPMAEFTLDF